MTISVLKFLPAIVMSEHEGVDLPHVGTGIIPQLDKMIETELAKSPDPVSRDVLVEIADQSVANRVFDIGGIVFYLRKDTKVSVRLLFERTPNGGGLSLREATYHFTRPALAGANIEVHPFKSLGVVDIGRIFCGNFTDDDVLKIMQGMTVSEYDKTATSGFIKPAMMAFDEIKVAAGKDGLPALRFALTSKECLNRGWGMFSFGISEKGCTASENGDKPGEFLGSGWATDKSDPVGVSECREVEMGRRIRMAFATWMIGGRRKSYNAFLEQSGRNNVAAMTFLLNEVMGIKAKKAPDSWDKFAQEERVLGRGYFRWLKNNSTANGD